MHFDTQNLILLGVLAHLLLGLSRTVFSRPKQTATIDAIDAKLSVVLDQVTAAAPVLAQLGPVIAGAFPRRSADGHSSAPPDPSASMALNPLIPNPLLSAIDAQNAAKNGISS